MTGCDSTSAFVGRGKKAAFDLIASGGVWQQAMASLGQEVVVSEELYAQCERFVCALYGSKDAVDVNDLRYRQFCLQRMSAAHLPPTKDALRKHVMRANYQAAVWRWALEADPDIPPPHRNGWIVSADGIVVDWMDQKPAPEELLSLKQCGCKTGCSLRRCSCVKASLLCTDACSCGHCKNKSMIDGDSDGPAEEPEDYNSGGEDSCKKSFYDLIF